MFVRSAVLLGPGWSGMVRDFIPAILNCLKLLCSSGAVRDEFSIRGSPGGPCSDRVNSGAVRSGTVLIHGDLWRSLAIRDGVGGIRVDTVLGQGSSGEVRSGSVLILGDPG